MIAKRTPRPVEAVTPEAAFSEAHKALVRALSSNRKALDAAAALVEAATRDGASDMVRGVTVVRHHTGSYIIASRV